MSHCRVAGSTVDPTRYQRRRKNLASRGAKSFFGGGHMASVKSQTPKAWSSRRRRRGLRSAKGAEDRDAEGVEGVGNGERGNSDFGGLCPHPQRGTATDLSGDVADDAFLGLDADDSCLYEVVHDAAPRIHLRHELPVVAHHLRPHLVVRRRRTCSHVQHVLRTAAPAPCTPRIGLRTCRSSSILMPLRVDKE